MCSVVSTYLKQGSTPKIDTDMALLNLVQGEVWYCDDTDEESGKERQGAAFHTAVNAPKSPLDFIERSRSTQCPKSSCPESFRSFREPAVAATSHGCRLPDFPDGIATFPSLIDPFVLIVNFQETGKFELQRKFFWETWFSNENQRKKKSIVGI